MSPALRARACGAPSEMRRICHFALHARMARIQADLLADSRDIASSRAASRASSCARSLPRGRHRRAAPGHGSGRGAGGPRLRGQQRRRPPPPRRRLHPRGRRGRRGGFSALSRLQAPWPRALQDRFGTAPPPPPRRVAAVTPPGGAATACVKGEGGVSRAV